MGDKAAARQGQRKGDFLGGKYLLGDCLGIGGMGEVYRATNVSLGRDVAVKILSKEFVENEDDVLRFLREARAAAMIRHGNVVDVLDVARDDDGTPFIVQELLNGEDLERYLVQRGGRLPPEEALEIMISVADAVGAAHTREVIHRDLKPANIFLSRDGNKIVPKVLDFGAARFATVGDLSAKEQRMLIGTPHYMAPEQIISKTDVDARADVWALGILLYELIVGETPFEAETANAVLALVKTREVPRLSKVTKRATPELEELVAKCTQRDKTKRWADAAKLAEAMRSVRDRMKGGSRDRLDTAPELEDPPTANKKTPDVSVHNKKTPELPPNTKIPSLRLDEPKPATAAKSPPKPAPPVPTPAGTARGKMPPAAPAGPAKSRLLTLSSPTSDPPPPSSKDLALEDDDLLAPPPSKKATAEYGEFALDEELSDHKSAPPSKPASSLPPRGEHELDRSFDEVDPADELGIDLAAPPSRDISKEKQREMQREQRERAIESSIPPVLDPRAANAPPARATASVRPPAMDLDRSSDPGPRTAVPTPAAAFAPSGGSSSSASSRSEAPPAPPLPTGAKITLAASILSPAVLLFVLLRIVHVTDPIGRAMRGDTMMASGVFTVVALVIAGALIAKSMQGTRDRTLFVAAGGALLFGIAMIITTFSAGEPPDNPEQISIGLAAWVAPIAPLAAAFVTLRRARAVWTSKWEGRERILFAALTSFLVLVALELGPLGAARSAPRAPTAPASSP